MKVAPSDIQVRKFSPRELFGRGVFSNSSSRGETVLDDTTPDERSEAKMALGLYIAGRQIVLRIKSLQVETGREVTNNRAQIRMK